MTEIADIDDRNCRYWY